MPRFSDVFPCGICRVIWFELEEEEVEFMCVPELEFCWGQPLPLGNGDHFLSFADEIVYLPEVFLREDVQALDKLYRLWRKSKGDLDPNELAETLQELHKEVRALLKAIGDLVPIGADAALELELQELRAEKGIA